MGKQCKGEDEYAAKNSGGVHMRGMKQPAAEPRDHGKGKASVRREPAFEEPLGRQAQQRFGTNEQRFDRPEDRSEMDSIRTMSANDPDEIEYRRQQEEASRPGFGAAFDKDFDKMGIQKRGGKASKTNRRASGFGGKTMRGAAAFEGGASD